MNKFIYIPVSIALVLLMIFINIRSIPADSNLTLPQKIAKYAKEYNIDAKLTLAYPQQRTHLNKIEGRLDNIEQKLDARNKRMSDLEKKLAKKLAKKKKKKKEDK